MSIWTSWWFWILVLSIIGFIVAFSSYESLGNTWNPDPNATVPMWIWVVFGVSLALFILAAFLYLWAARREYKEHLCNLAAGKVPYKEEEVVCGDPCNGSPKIMVRRLENTFVEKVPDVICAKIGTPVTQSTLPTYVQPNCNEDQKFAAASPQQTVLVEQPLSGKTVAIPLSALNPIFT